MESPSNCSRQGPETYVLGSSPGKCSKPFLHIETITVSVSYQCSIVIFTVTVITVVDYWELKTLQTACYNVYSLPWVKLTTAPKGEDSYLAAIKGAARR